MSLLKKNVFCPLSISYVEQESLSKLSEGPGIKVRVQFIFLHGGCQWKEKEGK
jgi:hypothetical protein